MKKIVVSNLKELEKVDKNSIIIVGNVGKKKKIEIIKKAREMKIKLSNLNINKFLEKNKEKKKEKPEEKKLKEVKKDNESK